MAVALAVVPAAAVISVDPAAFARTHPSWSTVATVVSLEDHSKVVPADRVVQAVERLRGHLDRVTDGQGVRER